MVCGFPGTKLTTVPLTHLGLAKSNRLLERCASSLGAQASAAKT